MKSSQQISLFTIVLLITLLNQCSVPLPKRSSEKRHPGPLATSSNQRLAPRAKILPINPDSNLEKVKTLKQAIVKKDYDKIESLIAQGVDINQPDRNGDTLLHFVQALYPNDYSITAILVGAGADLFAENSAGQFPAELSDLSQETFLLRKTFDKAYELERNDVIGKLEKAMMNYKKG